MLSSGLLIWGQTLLALAALGLAGGWALWPFRGPDRPYLWLAAPLAGLAALGGALLALYYGLRLPFAAALPLGWLGLSGVTLTCLLRGGLPRPGVRQGLVALAALGLGSAWGAYVCNRTAIEAGEPTLAVADGSDMFGYAMCADWLRAHPAAQPPRPDHLFEVLPYANLHLEGSRHAAFLLTAAAAQVRGTSSLFSYDWACGVALSAAAVGLGGVFAAGPVGLALLLAAAATSAWLVVSRTGYLGKTLAYPGCLLLTALYLGVLARPSAARVAAACLLGPAVAFCINPILPPLAVGAVLPGLLAALLLRRLSGGAAPGLSDGPPPWRLLVRAVVLYLAVTGPAFAAHRLLFGGGYPAYRLDWGLVVPAALDLESPTLDLVGAGPGRALAAGYFAATLLLLAVALRRGAAAAQGYLLGAALVPFAWLLDKPGVYGFHGLLYPLTMAGAALLLAPAGRRRPARLEGGAVALLAAALVALHVPQAHRAARRYLVGAPPGFAVLNRGELEALRAGVGDEAVDVSLGDYRDSLPVLSELACRGTAVRLRAPAWELTLANWAAGVGCPPPNAMAPKARFSITEREAFAPPGSVRYRGRRLQLCEDGDAVTFGAVRRAQAVVRDERGRPGYWLGNAPTVVEVHNGTGAAAAVRFRAEGRCGPANP
ncbi:MAG TPA: hypothetical protein VFE78_39860, partial [Gemmataceae bacterium]|nr:hypothetical protein [Gemmataceae bacterium]